MAVLEIAAVVALTYAAGKEVIDFIEDEERVVEIELVNATSRTMQKVRHSFESGGFGKPLPSDQLGPFTGATFVARGLGSGVDGSASYRVEGVGDFLAGFTNRFSATTG